MIRNRIQNIPRELKLFIIAVMAMGMANSIVDATFNNFLNERFGLSGFQRAFLEFPREIPGLIVVFVSAVLWFLCSRRLGALSMVFGAVGTALIGFASSSYGVMLLWLFMYSLGQHLFLPLSSSIGMELAHEGQAGKRLGQLNAVRNLAAIMGSFLVFVAFKYLHLSFEHTFALASLTFIMGAVVMFAMQTKETHAPSRHLKLYPEYRLFYILAVLFGSRKQLFLTFAPWVLVTIFHQPTQTIATLLTLGGVIGIVFQPLLGQAIDRLGERFVLCAEAFLLIFVCLGYGFAKFIVPEDTAFIIVCICFLLDQMLISVNMARATYIKKIALDSTHVQAALTASVSIDHIFSITVAILGGVIWSTIGFQYVFLMGTFIALLNLAAAVHVRLPRKNA